MIDKLDVRVPARVKYHPEFRRLLREVRGGPDDPFRSGEHYEMSGDLRKLGYSAVVHIGMKHGDQCECRMPDAGVSCKHYGGTHKVELIDTGRMTYAGMVNEIGRVFDVDARELGIMRLDLCADVPGVPVTWFAKHARVVFKRSSQKLGLVDFRSIAAPELQTLYYGKKPNQVRIYNKVAEWQHEYQVRQRGMSPAERAKVPSFESVYGVKASAVLTRVERQMGGGKIPHDVNLVWKLRANLEDFDPFDRLELIDAGRRSPKIEAHGLVGFAAGMYFRHLLTDEGWTLAELRGWLHKHSKGNAARILKKYADFMPSESRISRPRLVMLYRKSVARQLRAAA